jgi:soluble lytic murein transglycosylase-like protein
MSIKILSSINDAYLSRLESAKKSSGSTESLDSFADALEEAQETLASSELTDAEKNAIRAMAVDAAVSAIQQNGGYGISLDSSLAKSLGVSVVSTGQAEASSSVQVETAEDVAARVTAASTAATETQDTETSEETTATGTSEETQATESSSSSASALTSDDIETYAVNASYLNCSDELLSYFKEAAETYNVDEKLLRSFAVVESNFDPSATSKSGAMGVMQLMPATASELGVDDPYDAYQNIMGGAKLISQLLEKYDGDVGLTAAAYNAGSGAVAKCGGIPSSTEAYVTKVLSYYCS